MKMSFTDSIVQMAIQIAPFFVYLIFIFIIFCWLRILVDSMSGKGWS